MAALDRVPKNRAVAHPLTSADARALYYAAPRRAVRRLPGWAIFSAGIGLLVLAAAWSPARPCSESAPCGADVFASVELGLLVASMFVGWVAPVVAATAASACALANVADLVWRDDHSSTEGAIALLAYALIVIVCAAWSARLYRTPEAAEEWVMRSTSAVLPQLAEGSDRPGRVEQGAAVVLVLLAVGAAGLGLLKQETLDAEARGAEIVNGAVVSHPDEFHLAVRLADRDVTARVSVYTAADYPIGSTARFLVTDSGEVRAVTEPGDATGWIALGVVLAVAGLGIWVRGRRRSRARHRLLTESQPVTAVYLAPGEHLFAGDAQPGGLSFAQLDTHSLLRLEAGAALPYIVLPSGMPGVSPVLLYGIPMRGAEVAIADPNSSVLRTGRLTIPPVGIPFMPPGDSELDHALPL
jgi:hypothetical protein